MVEQNTGLASLFAKIAIISGKIGAIKPDKKHGQGYMYYSANEILGVLNNLMAEHGLVVIPTAPHVEIVNEVWLISYKFILCDAETGATFTAEWASSAPLKMGQNYDDKAMGKAHTYAHKYFLMKLFMVSSVETDDLDDNDKPAPAKAEKQAPKQDKPSAPAIVQKPSASATPNPDAALIEAKTLTLPLYAKGAAHQNNSVDALAKNEVIRADMPASEMAAVIFLHRALADYELDEAQVVGILKKHPRDFVQKAESFKKAWALIRETIQNQP